MEFTTEVGGINLKNSLQRLLLSFILVIILLHVQSCTKSKVILQTPRNRERNLPLQLRLSWEFSKNPKDYTFEIFLGEGQELSLFTKVVGQTSVNISDLKPATKYSWQVVVVSKNKRRYESQIWSFETTNPPLKPTNPLPQDGETLVETPTTLTWMCEDPDGDKLTYDLYFGEMGAMQLLASGLSKPEFSLDPDALKSSVTYFWQVVARDDKYAQTDGPIWSFTISKIEATPIESSIDGK